MNAKVGTSRHISDFDLGLTGHIETRIHLPGGLRSAVHGVARVP